jgi:hypothetical protein
MTAGPAGRIAALLALYRPVAAELFVAVDDRAEPAVVAAALAAGARVVRYPYAEPVDRPLAWLHHECVGDWVLTIDDDEVPSAGLLAALPGLVEAQDVTHYWLPRRWLFPEPGRHLDEAPWRPDYQLRLVRNDPRLLLFFEETHRPIQVLGPGRYLELPVYHADCVVNPLERREQKALKYERLRPGKRVAGGAMSHVFYLPERRPSAATRPLPEEDLRLVEQVLGSPPPSLPPPAAVPAATREEIDRHWVGRELPPPAYACHLELLQQPHDLVAGEQRALETRVRNLGDARWPWGELGLPSVRVSYRWYHAGGAVAVPDGLRTPFPAPVEPGERVVVPVHVLAPPAAGRYELELDLVHEHVRWFGCAVRVEVDVLRPRRVAVLDGARPVGHVLERLAGADPAIEPVVLGRCGTGHRSAPGLDSLLLGASAPRVVLRTLALLLAARRMRRRGQPPRRPRAAAGFLGGLADAELLVVPPPGPGARALWAATAGALAARALGVPVVLAGGRPPGGGPLQGVLGRTLARVATRQPLEAAVEEAAGPRE